MYHTTGDIEDMYYTTGDIEEETLFSAAFRDDDVFILTTI